MELFEISRASQITGASQAQIRYWIEEGHIAKDSDSRGEKLSEETIVWIFVLNNLRKRGCHYKRAAGVARAVCQSPSLSSARYLVVSKNGIDFSAYDTADRVFQGSCAAKGPVVLVDIGFIRSHVRALIGPSQIDIPIGVDEQEGYQEL